MKGLCISLAIFAVGGLGCASKEVPGDHEEDAATRVERAPPAGPAPVPAVALTGTTKKCASCHEEMPAKTFHVKGGVGCESCHAGYEKHLANPETKPHVPDQRSDCTACHASGAGPQIDAAKHYPGRFCASCHAIHGGKAGESKDEEKEEGKERSEGHD